MGGPILLVFDQFEEYLLYHASDKEGDAFDAEIAQTINREDIDANVLISLREDSLAALDKFNARIPHLLSNMLRLDHMDLVSADIAVRKPIEVYNGTESGNAAPVTIEDALVDAVIADVRIGQVRLAERGGTGRLDSKADTERVETSFLQLVLEKLWQADVEAGPRQMRLETYKRLGGAQEIVSSHFGQAMQKLDDSEQAVCARFFDRLVTPSGTKIAYSVSDLVQFAGGNEDEVARVLKKLTDARILRTIEARGGGENHGVEIFHDVMALPVLQWVAQFAQKKQKAAARRQVVKRIVQGAAILLFVTGFAAYRYYDLWLGARPWAYVEDLATGKVSFMQGAVFRLVVITTEFKNLVLLRPQTISRIHLLVDSSGMAFDMRSRNGTTVNAQFLPYAEGQQLEDGDLVTLAGVVPFRYHTINYAPLQFWVPSIPELKPPAGAWALVLDGSTREVTFLSSDVYYLSLNAAGQIILADRGARYPADDH